MKGIILAGGLGSRLQPMTRITNKHLLPVFDRPMIYYPLQCLVQAGIMDIMIVTGGNHAGDFLRLLKNGREFGLKHLNYTYQEGEGGIADALGLCFHVGSQAMTPHAYVQAMEKVRVAIVDAAVTVDIVDVGGGFPSVYPGMEPPALEHYFDAIHRAFESLPISYSAELWCEPGRALCAEYSSLIVRVEKRRGAELYINDGAYGALFDAAHIGWRFPVALLREPDSNARDLEFSFYGPTCDDLDHMAGPFLLPADVQAGDYIEIGMLGAYGAAMRTAFNGFGSDETVVVTDEPMVSLYVEAEPTVATNVVTL